MNTDCITHDGKDEMFAIKSIVSYPLGFCWRDVQQNRQLRLHHTFPYHQKESDKHKKIVDAIHSTSVNNFNNIIVYFLALRAASIF